MQLRDALLQFSELLKWWPELVKSYRARAGVEGCGLWAGCSYIRSRQRYGARREHLIY